MHYAALLLVSTEVSENPYDDIGYAQRGSSDSSLVPRWTSQRKKEIDYRGRDGPKPWRFVEPEAKPLPEFGTTVSTSNPFNNNSTPSGFGTFGTSTMPNFGGAFRVQTSDKKEATAKFSTIDEIIQCLMNCNINAKTLGTGATPLLELCKSLRHNSEAKFKNATSLIKHGANVNLAV